MKKYQLTEAGENSSGVNEIENLMDKIGIWIVGHNHRLVINGKEYRIGRDCDVFPRVVDEPFIRD
jgi:hypothetical protein